MEQITVPAHVDRIGDVFGFIDKTMRESVPDEKQQNNVKIAVEEIFVNIAQYAYPSGEGDVTVSVSATPGKLAIEFKDSGMPYNPLAKPDPDASLSAEKREIGGLGIYMVKHIMDEVSYEYRDGQNVLTIAKKRPYGNRKWPVVISLLCVNLLVSVLIALYLFIPSGTESGGVLDFESVQNGQYILYIGTNDRDTYEQIIQTDEAVEIVNGICAKYVEGYTMSHAKGGWVDEKGVLTQENTLVYTFAYADESDIAAIMDEVLFALNQNSILMERRNISSGFYYGRDNGQ